MKFETTLFAALLMLLPVLAQAQPGPKAVAASAPLGYSREKAADICTTAARSDWLTEEEMQLLAKHRGYRIKTFKVINNSCYEIYGFDREGRIVEAYFNPVTARLVRQNIAQ